MQRVAHQRQAMASDPRQQGFENRRKSAHTMMGVECGSQRRREGGGVWASAVCRDAGLFNCPQLQSIGQDLYYVSGSELRNLAAESEYVVFCAMNAAVRRNAETLGAAAPQRSVQYQPRDTAHSVPSVLGTRKPRPSGGSIRSYIDDALFDCATDSATLGFSPSPLNVRPTVGPARCKRIGRIKHR